MCVVKREGKRKISVLKKHFHCRFVQKFRVCLGVCGTQTMNYAFDVGGGKRKIMASKNFPHSRKIKQMKKKAMSRG